MSTQTCQEWVMQVFRGILPFLAYAIVSSWLDWRAAAVVAALVAAGLITQVRGGGRAWSELIVEECGLAWFVTAAVVGYVAPGLALRPYVGALGQLVLAGAVAGSLVAGRPFTLPMARRDAPRQVWDHPVFVAFNRRISTGWAVGLGASGLVMIGLLLAGITDVWLQVTVVVVGILAAVFYQRREIAAFRTRAADPATWQ